MRTAIVYYSKHHGNTKKLLDAIAAAAEVDLIDVGRQPVSGSHRVSRAHRVRKLLAHRARDGQPHPDQSGFEGILEMH